jgi:hypothetical protein
MILSETRLCEAPAVFRAMTGLQIEEFDWLAEDLMPMVALEARATVAGSSGANTRPKSHDCQPT